MPKRRRTTTADIEKFSTEADELIIYIDNDRDLHRRKMAIQTGLTRHVCRGGFQKAAAAVAFSHLTNEAGKKYAKEYADTDFRFPVAARRQVDREFVSRYLASLRDCREGFCGDLAADAVKLLQANRCKPGGELRGAYRRRSR